ncbi:MAG: hypothetical protein Q4E54_05770 [Lachnospiraceae bacterium]|nr:hypothetical protein [Lachnospiraceae bacterium]
MEKQLYFHPIILKDQKNLISFTCTILNNSPEKIDTLDALRDAIRSFGEEYGSLNCSGGYKGNNLLSYYHHKEDGVDNFKLRYIDKETGRVAKVINPVIEPDYMFDGVNQIY